MPVLKLFNTMGRSLQEFVPLNPPNVGFYGCGPTVYNYAHIGNLRTYIFEDVLVRTLRRFGYKVTGTRPLIHLSTFCLQAPQRFLPGALR